MPRGKKNNRKREVFIFYDIIKCFHIENKIITISTQRDAVTETIGEHNLQYIMSFIEPEMRSFARITCSMWRHSIK